jgi:hypothetical protein
MRQLGLNEQLLADACNRAALSKEIPLRMSRERVAKILMNCKKNPERSAAKVITCEELEALSSALSVFVEWLSGQRDNRDPIYWNVLAEPGRAKHLLHLLSEYEENVGELLVSAEFLMCSMVTPELMHAQHEVMFAKLDLIGLDSKKQSAVALFDRIGDARRKRLLRSKTERGHAYRQVIFYSDLKVIA